MRYIKIIAIFPDVVSKLTVKFDGSYSLCKRQAPRKHRQHGVVNTAACMLCGHDYSAFDVSAIDYAVTTTTAHRQQEHVRRTF